MKIIVQTPTPDINKSENFYTKLGFTKTSEAPIIYADDKVRIEINSDRFARTGLKLFKADWAEEKKNLQEFHQLQETENHTIVCLPGNLWVYLIEEDTPNFKLGKKSKLGNNHGMSLETTETVRLNNALEVLGFNIVMGRAEDSWFVMADESGFSVSLMKPNACPHLFFSPSFNLFNSGNNLEVIKEIRNQGIEITEEITHFNKEGIVDNVIIRDPGGLGFFVFND